ncbi:MAG: sigma 54-interacting transcriptional regulator [Deltaproteobacteria bacterium]|nr:sigma 54-interacting transcriptional regulator [Deltaproteobacteria bacterium]
MDEQVFFQQATMQICGNLDIGTSLHRSLTYLRSVMPADVLSLYLFEEGLGSYRTIAVATPECGRETDTIIPVTVPLRKLILTTGLPHLIIAREGFNPVTVRIVNHPKADPVLLVVTPYMELQDYSCLIMYLTIEEKKLGALVLQASGEGRYAEEHARLLSLLAEPFAISLTNRLRYEEILKLRDLLADDNRYLHRELHRISGARIIGGDYGLKQVMEMVRQVASLNSPVLLRGETGVGKDVVANAIHYSPPRHDGPLIKVNCGAIPETLVDSELFGHEKGAFTGAIAQKRGCFERANRGTIFLDEIGEIPPAAQIRMLHVLQYKQIERVGGSAQIPVDIRIIAATHRNLEELIRAGRFREDLWFRLNVFPIFIPPLRERMGDIPALVYHLINRKSRELNLSKIPSLAPGTIDHLMSYHWPGNVRELENLLERALILAEDGVLTPGLFLFDIDPQRVQPPDQDGLLPLDAVIARHIRDALKAAGGIVHGPQGAAHRLGINASTLRNRMNKLGIPYRKR